jgi:hypothetical protein
LAASGAEPAPDGTGIDDGTMPGPIVGGTA